MQRGDERRMSKAVGRTGDRVGKETEEDDKAGGQKRNTQANETRGRTKL